MLKKFLTKSLALLAFGAPIAMAADFPNAPIHMVIPFAAGGNTDIAGRLISKALSEELGQPVVIENKAGAGTRVATAYMTKAKPDGYTLMMTTIAIAVNPHLDKNPKYNYRNDFEPVASVFLNPLILTANPSVSASTLPAFVDWLKANKQTPYGSAGNGSAMHLAGEAFRQYTNTDVMHVPYGGESKVLVDLMGGQVLFAFTGVASSAEYIKSGKLKGIAYAGPNRSPLMPDLPTAKEQGLTDFTAYTWGVVLAPKGTPSDVVNKLNAALNIALKKPEVQQRLIELGFEPIADSTPQSTDKFIVEETQKWGKVVGNSGLVK